jgi:hypothetical protein
MHLPEPKSINPNKILGKMKKLFSTVTKAKIEKAVDKERAGIKEFVTKAYEDEFSEIPPKVANLIVQYLEESVS